MSDRTLAMVNFYMALEQIGFMAHNKVLIARNIPEEYRKLLVYPLVSNEHVLVFKTREDVRDLCREEEKRLEKMTGQPKQINDEHVAAIFIWNKMFGIISDEPLPETRWIRYFSMDKDGPCIICMEVKKKATICGNCVSVVCLECDEKLEDARCPGCTKEMSSLDKEVA